ncbi:head GIN domain-containing protein [Hymenobacter persicinus]|uniref:head GIN domain-containing protein n=1 Tax=Hymenobacter persicinus TaxID=2025506 RepID=UPI0013EA57F7|nr:head GIN domain-containing protein [Hymenobacter persicinus]
MGAGATLGAVLLLAACGKDHETDCLKSTGKVTTERRELAPFRILTANDNVDVTLVQDAETYAEVRTGKNLQEDIELTVSNGQLVIKNTSRCNWMRRYDTPREVTLHLPRLLDVRLHGQGNVRTAGNFRADTLFCHLVGAGDFDLDISSHYLNLDMYELGDVSIRGRADDAKLLVGGSGTLRAQGLQTRQCSLRLTKDSDGDAFVSFAEALFGSHAGTGTVHYQGNPAQVSLQVTDKGKVLQGN